MFKKIKKIDFLILNAYVKNPEIKTAELGKMLEVTEKTIRNRLQYLKENNFFSKQVLINPNAFNYNIRFDVFIKTNGNLQELKSILNSDYSFNILYAGTHWGDDDFSLQLAFQDPEDINKFKNKLLQLTSVVAVKMTMVPLVYKDTYNWVPNPKKYVSDISDEEFEHFEYKI